MRWDGNETHPPERLAHQALEAFEVRASPGFLPAVMRAADERQQPTSWLSLSAAWAPAALCLTTVLTLAVLLGLGQIEWPLSGGDVKPPPIATAPMATAEDDRTGVVIESELEAPAVALTSGLPVYYFLHLALDGAPSTPFRASGKDG